MLLPIEVWQLILISVCKRFYHRLKIIDYYYKCKLTDDILKRY